MSKPKHTEGPWIVNENLDQAPIVADEGADIFDFESVGFEMSANLRLAAAAPEMLEALELVFKHGVAGDCFDVNCDCEGNNKSKDVMRQVLAAIKKAKGEV